MASASADGFSLDRYLEARRTRRSDAGRRARGRASSACWSSRPARARASATSARSPARRASRRCRSRWSASATAACCRCRSATPRASAPATASSSARRRSRCVPVGPALLGRVIDPLRPAARRPRAARHRGARRRCSRRRSTRWRASRSSQPLATGVRAIDALLTCGRGQRVGLFGGSGVGKSTLLGMMARGTDGRRRRDGAGRRTRPRSPQLPRTRSRPGGSEPLGRRRLDVRQPAAGAPARRLRRDGDRRVLPRPGQERAADDGLGHALRDGAARSRAGRRRAADGQGLSALGVRAAAVAARARRQRARPRQHHRALHRAGRRRRHQRADRRRRARHPRRPHRPVARSRAAAITIRPSTCSRASAGRCRM